MMGKAAPSCRTRVVMVAQTPTPYYTAIQNALAELVELTVVFMGRVDRPGGSVWAAFEDPWGTSRRFRLASHPALAITVGRRDFRSQVSFGVSARLAHLNPEVLLIHSWSLAMLEPLAWATLARRPVILWSESALGTGLVRSRWSDLYRRVFVRRADAIVSIGSSATEYLRHLGAGPEDVLEHPLPSPLAGIIASGPLSAGAVVRRFLFVGRLVELKRPLMAIRAFLRLADEEPDVTLHVVGDGPLTDLAIAEASRHAGRVRFSRRLEGQDLAPIYVDADALVLPSEREVWGLVVNEALAAGLFVITSDRVGSSDLLGPGIGCQFPLDDEDALLNAMRTAMHEDSGPSARLLRRDRVAGVTPESFAGALAAAILRATGRRSR